MAGLTAALLFAAATLAGICCWSLSARTEEPVRRAPKPEMKESCPGLVASDRPKLVPAAYTRAALAADQVRISYAGHSTFLIESPKLVRIATDYNDWVKPPVRPDIVTMNHAHSTHYTDPPEPHIKFLLRRWRHDRTTSGHDLSFHDPSLR